ncbi:MAG: LysR family transcriptional regulator [Proteobacteria bacterium]|nr:LysR family transcriptional regulator [Pseudomonadota bacterium]
MPQISIHIDFEDEGQLEPRTVALLERIAEEGSISAAGRAMKISYKHAWELVAEVNRTFEEPLVKAQTGGAAGGGSVITERGQKLIRDYRALERKALSATARHLKAMQAGAGRQH